MFHFGRNPCATSSEIRRCGPVEVTPRRGTRRTVRGPRSASRRRALVGEVLAGLAPGDHRVTAPGSSRRRNVFHPSPAGVAGASPPASGWSCSSCASPGSSGFRSVPPCGSRRSQPRVPPVTAAGPAGHSRGSRRLQPRAERLGLEGLGSSGFLGQSHPVGPAGHSRGSSGSVARARTPKAAWCTRRRGACCTNCSSPSMPSANSRSASAILRPTLRLRRRVIWVVRVLRPRRRSVGTPARGTLGPAPRCRARCR